MSRKLPRGFRRGPSSVLSFEMLEDRRLLSLGQLLGNVVSVPLPVPAAALTATAALPVVNSSVTVAVGTANATAAGGEIPLLGVKVSTALGGEDGTTAAVEVGRAVETGSSSLHLVVAVDRGPAVQAGLGTEAELAGNRGTAVTVGADLGAASEPRPHLGVDVGGNVGAQSGPGAEGGGIGVGGSVGVGLGGVPPGSDPPTGATGSPPERMAVIVPVVHQGILSRGNPAADLIGLANPVEFLPRGRTRDEVEPQIQILEPGSPADTELARPADDSLLTGAADGSSPAGPGVVAAVPQAPASSGVYVVDPAAGEAQPGLDLPPPQGADLVAGFAPYDLQALEGAMRQLLGQLDVLGHDLSTLLAYLPWSPWLLSVVVLAVASEGYRRRLQRRARALALAGAADVPWDLGPPEPA